MISAKESAYLAGHAGNVTEPANALPALKRRSGVPGPRPRPPRGWWLFSPGYSQRYWLSSGRSLGFAPHRARHPERDCLCAANPIVTPAGSRS
jgi:hypothetical protein